MRDKNRIKPFLEYLEKCWEKYPDWRFMQLVCNVQRAIGQDGFYIEDDKMLEVFKQYFVMGEEE